MTDKFAVYWCLSAFIRPESVNHQVEYVSGNIHTNSLESLWALLKRGVMSQYHRVSKRYLPSYLDEFCCRYNNREFANAFEITLA